MKPSLMQRWHFTVRNKANNNLMRSLERYSLVICTLHHANQASFVSLRIQIGHSVQYAPAECGRLSTPSSFLKPSRYVWDSGVWNASFAGCWRPMESNATKCTRKLPTNNDNWIFTQQKVQIRIVQPDNRQGKRSVRIRHRNRAATLREGLTPSLILCTHARLNTSRPF